MMRHHQRIFFFVGRCSPFKFQHGLWNDPLEPLVWRIVNVLIFSNFVLKIRKTSPSPPVHWVRYRSVDVSVMQIKIYAFLFAIIVSSVSVFGNTLKGLFSNFGGLNGLSFIRLGDCDLSKCDPIPKHYEELGCEPTKKDGECCPKMWVRYCLFLRPWIT